MNYTNNTDFKTEYTKGEVGEEKFIEYLNFRNTKFRDVRFEKEYQRVDVDFIVEDIKYEVKTDYNISKTGNIALEFSLDSKDYKRDGWWRKTEANQLAIYDAKNKFFYIVHVEALRNLLKNRSFRSITTRTYDNGIYTEALLLLVPIYVLQKEGIAYKVQTLQEMIYNKGDDDIKRLKWVDALL